jgi:arsenite methyltransferase
MSPATRNLRDGVREAYGAVAEGPARDHPFPVGREFALSLGYPASLLDELPAICVDAFTGVSNVSIGAEIAAGSTVLDLGCGAGLDCLVAARKTGPGGKVVGIDFSAAMLARARQASGALGLEQVEFRKGDAERVPLEDGSVDVALVNGIFNLNPTRAEIFAELVRLLRPGGRAWVAELVLRSPPAAEASRADADWFA